MKTMIVGVAALVAATGASGQLVVVPNALASAPGTAGAVGPLSDAAYTYQMVIDAPELATVPVGSQITGFAWRAFISTANPASWPMPDCTFSDYDIRLAPAATSAATISTTFANNIGPGEVQVRGGSLTIPAAAFVQGAGGAPSPWGFEIPFTTPYTYTGGNLVFTLRHSAANIAGGLLCDGDPPSPGRRYAAIAVVGGGAAGGAVAAIVTKGRIVPAPASMMVLVLAGAMSARRRRN